MTNTQFYNLIARIRELEARVFGRDYVDAADSADNERAASATQSAPESSTKKEGK